MEQPLDESGATTGKSLEQTGWPTFGLDRGCLGQLVVGLSWLVARFWCMLAHGLGMAWVAWCGVERGWGLFRAEQDISHLARVDRARAGADVRCCARVYGWVYRCRLTLSLGSSRATVGWINLEKLHRHWSWLEMVVERGFRGKKGKREREVREKRKKEIWFLLGFSGFWKSKFIALFWFFEFQSRLRYFGRIFYF